MGNDSDIELANTGFGLGLIAVTVVVFVTVFLTGYSCLHLVAQSNTGATQRQNVSIMNR